MDIHENVPVGSKTTMRIGGVARYYAELLTKGDIEKAAAFAVGKKIPLILLGGGSNTIFADGTIEALVVRIKAERCDIRPTEQIIVQAGKILASLINECAEQGLDLSPLTGIPGSVGGAVFGNAGQGPKGTWINAFVVNVTAFVDGEWRTFAREECRFEYRESVFKSCELRAASHESGKLLEGGRSKVDARSWKLPPIIWEVTLSIPAGDPTTIKTEIERLIQKRIATQPHLKTAGSCFKAVGERPAWQLIDAAKLRGHRIGGIQIAEKHTNFLLNVENGSYDDAKRIVEMVKGKVSAPLDVEMRFIENDGSVAF